MAIDAINLNNPFSYGKVSGYQTPVTSTQGGKSQQTTSSNPFSDGMDTVKQIAYDKAVGADVGLGGTNNPTDTLGNKLMYAA